MPHRHRSCLAVAACLITFGESRWALADYPVMSHRYLADPGSIVYDGRVYLYNSNDDDNAVAGGYSMHSIVCVSSVDLKNWTDHGIVFQVPADASWAQNSWAPQPVARDGKIYLYFGNSGSGVGVATSTDPTGGFKDGKGSVLVSSSTPGASGDDSWLFDPGVLIDDDGTAYLAFGGNGINNARIIKLGGDLVSVSGSAVQVSTPNFFEASFLFKRKGIYYYSFSTNSSDGTRIGYMTSSSPMSGYTYKGTIAGQPPSNNNNNHASQFEYGGQWYHAYHNRIVSTQEGISTTYKRNLGIEVLSFKDNGDVQEITYTTDGVPQVGTLNPYVRVEAETMNAQSGIETEACSEGGMDVTDIGDGDWIRVRGVDFGTAGAKTFSARVASSSAGGSIELHLGTRTGTLIGKCTVPSTGGAKTWASTTCDVTGATGVNDLYLTFHGGGFSFNYWQFTGGDGDAGTTGSGGAAGAAPVDGGSAVAGGKAGKGGAAGQGGALSRDAGHGAGGAIAGSAGSVGGTGGAGTPGGSRGVSGAETARGGSTSIAAGGASVHAGSSLAGGAGNGDKDSSGGSGGGSRDGALEPTPPSRGGCSCTLGRQRPGASVALFFGIAAMAIRGRRSLRKNKK